MIFLFNNKNDKDIFYTSNIERAKEMVSLVYEEDGFLLGVYGAKNREQFLLLYPEYKGRYFVSIGN